MFCPRLRHFVRLNQDGTIGKCGHMTGGEQFANFEDLHKSKWLANVEKAMENNIWPSECSRCQTQESIKGESIRTNSIARHKVLYPKQKDYLIVGGVLDNICNSACQSCNSNLSTKIGSLERKDYKKINNLDNFYTLPQDRILELDVNGGEPTASPNYKKLLTGLPDSVRIVRMNTNGSRMIKEIEMLLEKGVMVIVTLSLDGVESVHDYVRWPIKWEHYTETVDRYLEIRDKHSLLKLDFWTTVSALNINNFADILEYARAKNIPHDYAPLYRPGELDIRHKNFLTGNVTLEHPLMEKVGVGIDNDKALRQFIAKNDRLRGIDITDYLNLEPK